MLSLLLLCLDDLNLSEEKNYLLIWIQINPIYLDLCNKVQIFCSFSSIRVMIFVIYVLSVDQFITCIVSIHFQFIILKLSERSYKQFKLVT